MASVNANPKNYAVLSKDYKRLGDIQGDLADLLDRDKSPKIIPTGFKFFDNTDKNPLAFYGGLPQGITILGGQTGAGKTTFFWQLAEQLSQQGTRVIYFSLEMPKSALLAKTYSRLLGIDTGKIVHGKTSEQELKQMKNRASEIAQRLKNVFIYTEDLRHRPITIESLKKIITEQVGANLGRKNVIMIDYLQLISPATNYGGTDKQFTDKVINELMALYRRFKIPIIAISSLNRESYKEQKLTTAEYKEIKEAGLPLYKKYPPLTLGSFKESGSIEYSATCVLALENDTYYKAREGIERIKLRVLKNRYGAKASEYLYPNWQNQTFKEGNLYTA